MSLWTGFEKGMGIGGWLTNYKRFNVLPQDKRLSLTDGDMEHFAGYITEKDVAYIASLGMDHIRLGFDQIVLEEAPGRYRESILRKMDEFVSWCRRYNLNIVLNLHKALGNYCDIEEMASLLDDQALQERFIALWEMLEKHYADQNDIAFELLNEVRNVDPQKWNTLALRTVSALRKINAERKLVIGSICWNAPHALQYLPVDDSDPNLIYTFHMYAPHEFTHQRAVLHWAQCYYNRDMPYPGDIELYRDYMRVIHGKEKPYPNLKAMDYAFVEQSLQPVLDFRAARPNATLWCGEFGTIRHAKPACREAWMRDVIRFLKTHEISYCVWNYLSTPYDGNRFSLVDDDTRVILSDELARIIRGDV